MVVHVVMIRRDCVEQLPGAAVRIVIAHGGVVTRMRGDANVGCSVGGGTLLLGQLSWPLVPCRSVPHDRCGARERSLALGRLWGGVGGAVVRSSPCYVQCVVIE